MLFILESLLVIQCCHHCHHHNHQHYHYPPLHRRHTTEYQLARWAFMEMWTVCTPYGARWGSRWGNLEHEYKSIRKCVCMSTSSQVWSSETKGSYWCYVGAWIVINQSRKSAQRADYEEQGDVNPNTEPGTGSTWGEHELDSRMKKIFPHTVSQIPPTLKGAMLKDPEPSWFFVCLFVFCIIPTTLYHLSPARWDLAGQTLIIIG